MPPGFTRPRQAPGPGGCEPFTACAHLVAGAHVPPQAASEGAPEPPPASPEPWLPSRRKAPRAGAAGRQDAPARRLQRDKGGREVHGPRARKGNTSSVTVGICFSQSWRLRVRGQGASKVGLWGGLSLACRPCLLSVFPHSRERGGFGVSVSM